MATCVTEPQESGAPLASAGGTRDGDLVNDDVKRLDLTNVIGYSGKSLLCDELWSCVRICLFIGF